MVSGQLKMVKRAIFWWKEKVYIVTLFIHNFRYREDLQPHIPTPNPPYFMKISILSFIFHKNWHSLEILLVLKPSWKNMIKRWGLVMHNQTYNPQSTAYTSTETCPGLSPRRPRLRRLLRMNSPSPSPSTRGRKKIARRNTLLPRWPMRSTYLRPARSSSAATSSPSTPSPAPPRCRGSPPAPKAASLPQSRR